MSQLGIRTESFGAGDLSWLASSHGTASAKSASLDPTAWSAKVTADGRIKSGEACAVVSGLAVPYNSAGSGGTNVLAGFVLTDQTVRTGGGNITFPMVWHGRVYSSKLPSTVAAGVVGLFVVEA